MPPDKDDNLRLHQDTLAPIINQSAGVTFAKYTELLWIIRMIRYCAAKQISALPDHVKKVRGKRDALVDLGYLDLNDGIYTATDKSINLLSSAGRRVSLLNPPLTGEGKTESLRKTDVYIDAMKLKNFVALLFPRFDYLIPDALLVQGTPERYKLTFLEIEAEKPNWESYLENKRRNYAKLGQDEQAYRYWKNPAEMLGLPYPPIEKFCFSVQVIGKIVNKWEGWNFGTDI